MSDVQDTNPHPNPYQHQAHMKKIHSIERTSSSKAKIVGSVASLYNSSGIAYCDSSKPQGSNAGVMLISNLLIVSDCSPTSNSQKSFRVVGGSAETRTSSVMPLGELVRGCKVR